VFCIFQFLSRVADVLTDYLGDLNEDIIKDNFVIVYQVYFSVSATPQYKSAAVAYSIILLCDCYILLNEYCKY
jgi:hypothetical protein